MISHNMEDVRAVADRIVVLRLGRNNGVFYARRHRTRNWSAPSPAPPTTRSRAAPSGARPSASKRRSSGHDEHRQTQTTPPRAARPQRRARQARGRDRRRGPRLPRPRPLAATSARCRSSSAWSSSGRSSPASTRSSCRASNLVNLLFDCSTVGVIALGIVCVLMVGEIDLSVGSISGFASALVGIALGQPGLAGRARDRSRPSPSAALIGSLYALLFNRFGMPSFVSTLAGLLARAGPAALHPRRPPARSTCPTARRW